MVSYTAPVAALLPNPTGLDREIQTLQQHLVQRLPWLQLCYGRATRGARLEEGKTVYFPEVYDGAGEYRDVLPNDEVRSQAFFCPRDPATLLPGSLPGTADVRQTVDLIVWVNLQQVDAARPDRFELELKQQVLRALSLAPVGLQLQRTYDAPEQVYQSFSLSPVSTQCLRAPFAGFRIQLELTYTDSLC